MPARKDQKSIPTIRDVAAQVGVSPATVSRVLNNYPFIRPEVRERVLDAISGLGYERNRVAQRLRATRSMVVGIIVADITNPFLNTIMATVESFFFERGYSVLMSNTASDPQKELDYLAMMENEAAAGLVVVPNPRNLGHIADLANDLPIVVVDRRIPNAALDCVLSDNVAGARSAVAHLVELGHTRIGHIGGPMTLTSGRERYQGYLEGMEEARLSVEEGWVRFGNHGYESGYENAGELMNAHPELTALFIENNMMSLGALNALHERKTDIPGDVSIVGFDDMPWSTILNPPLTVIAQSTIEIGNRAAKLLLERIENPALAPRTELLATTLIVRGSSGPPPEGNEPLTDSKKHSNKRGGRHTT